MSVVVLVNPDIERLQERFGTVTLTKLKPQPPLGLCSIAATLLECGHSVSIVDGYAEALTPAKLADRVLEFNPEIVGFTVTCLNAEHAELSATLIKRRNNKIKIVFGGPQVTLQSDSALDCPAVDYAVLEEGDLTFPQMVEALEQNSDLSEIPGIILRDSAGRPKLTAPPVPVAKLDSLPLPARHLLDWDNYNLSGDYLMPAHRVFTLSSSRGCPYQCTFCSSATHWRSAYRSRSPENVVDEIETLIRDFGADALNFREDNFMVNHRRVADICLEIKRRSIRIPWVCEARVDNLNPEILALMKEAGLTGIWCGVESGSPKILKQIKKGYSVDQIRQAFKWINQLGLTSRAGFMIGIPDETEEDIQKTLDLAISIEPTHAYFQSYVAFPRSELYDYVEKNHLYCDKWRDVYNVKPRNIEKNKYHQFESEMRHKFDQAKILRVNNKEYLNNIGERVLVFCTAGLALIDAAISQISIQKSDIIIDALCNKRLLSQMKEHRKIEKVFSYQTDFLYPVSLPLELDNNSYDTILILYNNENGQGYENVVSAAKKINFGNLLRMNNRGIIRKISAEAEKNQHSGQTESVHWSDALAATIPPFVKGEGRLHLGCGGHLLEGWLNVDIKNAPGIIQMKLPEGLRHFESSSMRLIYASHFLEHLAYPGEALEFLKECYRLLTPGGTIRLIVPGIEKIIRAYVADDEIFFKVQEQFHPKWCSTKLEHLMYALQQDGEHKYGYDFETLSKLLRQAGFGQIFESDYNESPCDTLRIDYRGKGTSLFVEASCGENSEMHLPESASHLSGNGIPQFQNVGLRVLVFCTSGIAIVESALRKIRKDNPDCILETLSNQALAARIKGREDVSRQYVYTAENVSSATLTDERLQSLKEQHFDTIVITFSNGLGQGYDEVIEVARSLRPGKLLSYNRLGVVGKIAIEQQGTAIDRPLSHNCELS